MAVGRKNSPLVDSIINSETKKVKSCLITGRAGTGKSHLIKEIQKRLHVIDIPYITLSPTNVACIYIDGITINRFINKVSRNIKKNRTWKITPDVDDDDFSPLVDSIINSETKKI